MNLNVSKASPESLGLSWREKHSGRWNRRLRKLTVVEVWGLRKGPTQFLRDCVKSQDETLEGFGSKLSLPQHAEAGKVTSFHVMNGQRDRED